MKLALAAALSLLCSACHGDGDGAGGADGAPPGDEGDSDAGVDADGGGETGGGLGAVAVVEDECPEGDGALSATDCRVVEVTCPGVPALRAQVRITEPAGDSVERGTILFGLGGGGTEWYEGAAGQMLASLSQSGFRLVQRAWISQWEGGPGGLAAASCRYATLLTWVHDEVRTSGALCATGNSGGSSEIAYALSRWGRESILDLAVPTGGPVMTRLDSSCLDYDSWPAHCEALVPEESTCASAEVQCHYAGSNFENIDGAYTPETPCQDKDAAFADTFLADSILSPDADVDFATTRVHQIIGDHDCSLALVHGVLWHDYLKSDKAMTFAPDTGHTTPGSEAGAEAIRATMVEECVER